MPIKRYYKSLKQDERQTDQDWVEARTILQEVDFDPDIFDPQEDEALQYNAATNRWINKIIVEPVFSFTWQIYKAGTLYKARGSNGLTYSGSNLKTDVWDNIKSNPVSRTRLHFLSNTEPYDIPAGSTLDVPAAASHYYVSGESLHGVRLRPLDNDVMMNCTNLRHAKFDNLQFYVDLGATYTNDIFQVISSNGGCESIEFANIKMRHDAGTNPLTQTGRNLVLLLKGNPCNHSWINAHDCHTYGGDSAVCLTTDPSVTGVPWSNSNLFTRFHATHSKHHFLSQMPVVGGGITRSDAWHWIFRDCGWQTAGSTLGYTSTAMFSILNNARHRHFVIDGCMMWDPPTTTTKFLINNSLDSRIAIINSEPIGDVFMSGTAWDITNGKWNVGAHVTRQSALSHKQGVHKANGNGVQTVFNIPHGMADYVADSGTVTITPKLFDARPRSPDAKTYSDYTVTADATNIYLTYAVAPITGTNNLTWQWEAREFL